MEAQSASVTTTDNALKFMIIGSAKNVLAVSHQISGSLLIHEFSAVYYVGEGISLDDL